MNEIIIAGGVNYATEKIQTGIDTISFTLIDPPQDIEEVFGDVKELKVSDIKGEVYGEYPDVEYESVTIAVDGKVTVTMHISTKIERQIRELQTVTAEHDEAIATMMFGGGAKMSRVAKNIMVRAVKNRLAAGEKLEDIIKDYPGLTKDEIKEIKEAL